MSSFRIEDICVPVKVEQPMSIDNYWLIKLVQLVPAMVTCSYLLESLVLPRNLREQNCWLETVAVMLFLHSLAEKKSRRNVND